MDAEAIAEKLLLDYVELSAALAAYFMFVALLMMVFKVPRVSFSSMYLYLNGLVVLLPVSLVSLGFVDAPLDLPLPAGAYEIFYFVFFSSVAAALALLLGFHFGSAAAWTIEPRLKLTGLTAVFFGVFGVLAYFVLLSDVPLYSPLLESLNSGSLSDGLHYRADARRIGSDGGLLNLDWFVAPVLTVLLAAVLARRKQPALAWKRWLICFLVLMSLLVVKANRLGRDEVAWTIMFIMLSGSYGGQKVPARAIFYFAALLSAGFLLFSAHIDSFVSFSSSVVDRIFSQTTYSVFQWEYVSLDLFSGAEVNPSKAVYTDIFGKEGGSTAGFAALHLVAAYGIFGGLFYLVSIFTFGMIEGSICKAYSAGSPSLVGAGLIILSAFLIPALFNITGFFSVNYVFSTSGWMFLISLFFLFKVRRKNVYS